MMQRHQVDRDAEAEVASVRSAIAASSISGVGITEKRGAKCTSASHTVLKPSRSASAASAISSR